MKIALITQTAPKSDYSTVTAQLLINGPAELKVVGLPLNVFDTVELTPEEDSLVRRMISSGEFATRDVLNGLMSKVASASFYKGNAVGHNEAVMER